MQYNQTRIEGLRQARGDKAWQRLGKAVLLFCWMCFTHRSRTQGKTPSRPVRLTELNTETQFAQFAHGTAIVYLFNPQANCLTADLLDPAWYQCLPVAEIAFRVDKPQLLQRIQDSALRHLASQFEQYGFRVKELRLNVGGTTILYFLS